MTELKCLVEGTTDITVDLIDIVITVLVIEVMDIETMAIGINILTTMANVILVMVIDIDSFSITGSNNDITYL